MTGVSRQKQKLLTMKKLFETKTDEKHTITGNRLIEILGDYGIKAERKTIYDDIKTLCDSGLRTVTPTLIILLKGCFRTRSCMFLQTQLLQAGFLHRRNRRSC